MVDSPTALTRKRFFGSVFGGSDDFEGGDFSVERGVDDALVTRGLTGAGDGVCGGSATGAAGAELVFPHPVSHSSPTSSAVADGTRLRIIHSPSQVPNCCLLTEHRRSRVTEKFPVATSKNDPRWLAGRCHCDFERELFFVSYDDEVDFIACGEFSQCGVIVFQVLDFVRPQLNDPVAAHEAGLFSGATG